MGNEKQEILVRASGPVCTITINRPQKRNSLSSKVLRLLSQALEEADGRNEIRALIIRGAGDKAFCAGFDIDEIPVGEGDEVGSGEHQLLEETFQRVRSIKQPVIAMINGTCLGAGLDLAVNCDFRLAREGIYLGMTPAKLGVTYHPAGINRFLQLLGVNATRELFLTGKLISPEKAVKMGLINQVLPAERLEEEVTHLAGEMAANAPLALQSLKYTINRLTEKFILGPEETETINRMAVKAFNSLDLAEGQKAFREKRKPVFTGK